MSSIGFLKLAYGIAWVTYLGYLLWMLLRMRRVEEEIAEVERAVSSDNAGQLTSETPR